MTGHNSKLGYRYATLNRIIFILTFVHSNTTIMKKLIFMLMMVGGVNCYGQLTMTHGEVFNYDVGDEFCVQYKEIAYQQSWPPYWLQPYTYYKTTILSKSFSSLMDTVFYNCKNETQQNVYVLNAAQTNYEWQSTYSIQNTSLYYTDLNSPIQNYPFAYFFNEPCYSDSIDSVYIDTLQYCNRKIWHMNPIDSACLEPANETWDYVSGCGGPYYFYMEYFSGPLGISSKLIYYKKGNDTCGSYINMATGFSETDNPKFEITLYPNPTSGIFTIESTSAKLTSIKIMNVLGECVYHSEIRNSNVTQSLSKSEINLTGVSKGIYFLQANTAAGIVNKKIMVE